MPSLPVIQQLRRDAISRKVAFRALEPDLIMEDAAQVGRLPRGRSGWRGKGSGLPVPCHPYLRWGQAGRHRAGSGLWLGQPAGLGLIARLNPDVRFIGVDLSDEMLDMAERNLQALGIANVTLRHGDITDLNPFGAANADAVMSTVVLHHLPDEATVFRSFG